MRVAIQGDIGQPVYHVGDEAMTHAAVDQLTDRGLTELVLLTRSPEQTQHHFGAAVRTASTLEFPWGPAERERYLWEIKAVMAGETGALPPHDQVFGLIESLREVDALFIAGGGNLNSRYGWLLYERAAMAHIAVALGKQVVLGGQTLGPELSTPDRGALSNLLRNASLVGLREDPSFVLAQALSPRHRGFRPCLDDAAVLRSSDTTEAALIHGPYVAVTFNGPHDARDQAPTARAYARLADSVSEHVGAPLVFVPHMATPGAGDGDEAFHHAVVDHVKADIAAVLTIDSALRTFAVTKRSAAVVTSRYHPVVFAASQGIPAVAVAPDLYTVTRIAGAWDRFGSPQQPIPLAALQSTSLSRDWLAPLDRPVPPPEAWEADHAQWWDDVAAALASSRGRYRKRARHTLRTVRHHLRRVADRR